MELKYLVRTEPIECMRVITTNIDESCEEFTKRQKRRGWFNTGFHFLIHGDGSIESDIPLLNYADATLPEWRTTAYVLAMGVNDNELTDAQSVALSDLQAGLKLPLKESLEVCQLY